MFDIPFQPSEKMSLFLHFQYLNPISWPPSASSDLKTPNQHLFSQTPELLHDVDTSTKQRRMSLARYASTAEMEINRVQTGADVQKFLTVHPRISNPVREGEGGK